MNTRLAHEPPISNARLGMMLFVAAEVMLFSGLIAGYVVLKFGSGNFRGIEPLPVGLTGISTGVIAASSVLLIAATRGARRGNRSQVKFGALGALILGTLFLGLQVLEWNQLMGQGVLPSANVLGGMFYMLSWAHALHVFGGLVLLAVLASAAFRGKSLRWRNLDTVASIYWHFVTLIWIALFYMLFVV